MIYTARRPPGAPKIIGRARPNFDLNRNRPLTIAYFAPESRLTKPHDSPIIKRLITAPISKNSLKPLGLRKYPLLPNSAAFWRSFSESDDVMMSTGMWAYLGFCRMHARISWPLRLGKLRSRINKSGSQSIVLLFSSTCLASLPRHPLSPAVPHECHGLRWLPRPGKHRLCCPLLRECAVIFDRQIHSGMVKKKVDPFPGSDSTQMRPRYRSTIRWQIASPIPVPAYSSLPWRRLNNPKIRSLYSGLIPMPLSCIRNSQWRPSVF